MESVSVFLRLSVGCECDFFPLHLVDDRRQLSYCLTAQRFWRSESCDARRVWIEP